MNHQGSHTTTTSTRLNRLQSNLRSQQQQPEQSLLNGSHNNTRNSNNNNNNDYSNNTGSTMTEAANNINNNNFDVMSWQHMTRTLAHYERLEQIGEGTYGQVYRARCKDTGRIVAMKKMRIHHGGYWGMPLQLIREIKILKRLRHPRLLSMIEVVTSKGVEYLDNDDPPLKAVPGEFDKATDAREAYKGNLFLVLEYVEHDLTGLLDVAYQFDEVQIKCIFKQLLEALAFMHENKYVHRDIKSSNILLDSRFRLKLADFGLARSIEPTILEQMQQNNNNHNDRASSSIDLTNKVITLWYRPPEILFGTCQYGPTVDVWSAGCILAELLTGKPLFPGKTEFETLTLIVDLLGSPSDETWDFFSRMKKDKKTSSSATSSGGPPVDVDSVRGEMTVTHSRMREKYSGKVSGSALNLLEKLLEWDPRKRLTAANALQHSYFWKAPPAPEDPAMLGTIQVGPDGHFHEFQTKKKRKEAKAAAEQARSAAREMGATQLDAENEADKVYKAIMKRVAQEGITTTITKPQQHQQQPDVVSQSLEPIPTTEPQHATQTVQTNFSEEERQNFPNVPDHDEESNKSRASDGGQRQRREQQPQDLPQRQRGDRDEENRSRRGEDHGRERDNQAMSRGGSGARNKSYSKEDRETDRRRSRERDERKSDRIDYRGRGVRDEIHDDHNRMRGEEDLRRTKNDLDRRTRIEQDERREKDERRDKDRRREDRQGPSKDEEERRMRRESDERGRHRDDRGDESHKRRRRGDEDSSTRKRRSKEPRLDGPLEHLESAPDSGEVTVKRDDEIRDERHHESLPIETKVNIDGVDKMNETDGALKVVPEEVDQTTKERIDGSQKSEGPVPVLLGDKTDPNVNNEERNTKPQAEVGQGEPHTGPGSAKMDVDENRSKDLKNTAASGGNKEKQLDKAEHGEGRRQRGDGKRDRSRGDGRERNRRGDYDDREHRRRSKGGERRGDRDRGNRRDFDDDKRGESRRRRSRSPPDRDDRWDRPISHGRDGPRMVPRSRDDAFPPGSGPRSRDDPFPPGSGPPPHRGGGDDYPRGPMAQFDDFRGRMGDGRMVGPFHGDGWPGRDLGPPRSPHMDDDGRNRGDVNGARGERDDRYRREAGPPHRDFDGRGERDEFHRSRGLENSFGGESDAREGRDGGPARSTGEPNVPTERQDRDWADGGPSPSKGVVGGRLDKEDRDLPGGGPFSKKGEVDGRLDREDRHRRESVPPRNRGAEGRPEREDRDRRDGVPARSRERDEHPEREDRGRRDSGPPRSREGDVNPEREDRDKREGGPPGSREGDVHPERNDRGRREGGPPPGREGDGRPEREDRVRRDSGPPRSKEGDGRPQREDRDRRESGPPGGREGELRPEWEDRDRRDGGPPRSRESEGRAVREDRDRRDSGPPRITREGEGRSEKEDRDRRDSGPQRSSREGDSRSEKEDRERRDGGLSRGRESESRARREDRDRREGGPPRREADGRVGKDDRPRSREFDGRGEWEDRDRREGVPPRSRDERDDRDRRDRPPRDDGFPIGIPPVKWGGDEHPRGPPLHRLDELREGRPDVGQPRSMGPPPRSMGPPPRSMGQGLRDDGPPPHSFREEDPLRYRDDDLRRRSLLNDREVGRHGPHDPRHENNSPGFGDDRDYFNRPPPREDLRRGRDGDGREQRGGGGGGPPSRGRRDQGWR